jgi:hypothetical protein
LLDDHRPGRKEPNMMIIGVDYHPSFQTIAFFIEETGECGEAAYLTRGAQRNRKALILVASFCFH